MSRSSLLLTLVALVALHAPPVASAAPSNGGGGGDKIIPIKDHSVRQTQIAERRKVFIEGIGVVEHERVEVFTLATSDMHLFAIKASERLLTYSEATGYEACGVIAKNQNLMGLVITTNRSHIACAIQTKEVPEGMVSTNVDIHSHGLGAAKMNKSDLLFARIPTNARSRHAYGMVYGQDRNMFSEADLTLGAGYLAAPNGTLYHDGKGKIGMIKSSP